MPAPKDINLYENPFGHELRRHRIRLELSQVQLGKRLGYSEDTIGKIETGGAGPTVEFARDCDTMFGTHGAMENLARLVRKGGVFPRWMREWVDAEQNARTLRSWELVVVPGLLQTAEYARELLRAEPDATDERVEEMVTARMERQAILDRDEPPQLRVVLHENVLHYQVGEPRVVHDQLQAVIEAAQHPRITVQVVPAPAAAHSGMNGAFAIANFNGEPDVVYLESARAGQVTDRPDVVQAIADIWEAIRAEALPASASLELIAKVKEQWT